MTETKKAKKPEETPVENTAETPDFQELYKRALADTENMRKRFETEKQLVTKFARAGAAADLLPVVDNFHLAVDHTPADQQDSPWLVGILHIQKQLVGVLEEWGVQELSVKPGDAFDSEIHEAVATESDPNLKDDVIVKMVRRGYKIHDRVLRPVNVITNSLSETK